MLVFAAASFARVGRVSLPFWLLMTIDWLWAATPTADSRLRRLVSHPCYSQKKVVLAQMKTNPSLAHLFWGFFLPSKRKAVPAIQTSSVCRAGRMSCPYALVPEVTVLGSHLEASATNVMFTGHGCCWYLVFLGTCSDFFFFPQGLTDLAETERDIGSCTYGKRATHSLPTFFSPSCHPAIAMGIAMGKLNLRAFHRLAWLRDSSPDFIVVLKTFEAHIDWSA